MSSKTDTSTRHTFYIEPMTVKQLKFFALMDDRGVSEIAREALDQWLTKRSKKKTKRRSARKRK